MDTKELLKKVRKIEIKTRRLSDHVFGGEYHSTFKGRGMTFSEVRQYQYGDDVRNIDFNYTTSSVGYYFDVIRDHQIDPAIACKSAEVFNRESYYVDLDFKCSDLTEHTNYYIDLYGPVTEPEICP